MIIIYEKCEKSGCFFIEAKCADHGLQSIKDLQLLNNIKDTNTAIQI